MTATNKNQKPKKLYRRKILTYTWVSVEGASAREVRNLSLKELEERIIDWDVFWILWHPLSKVEVMKQ